MLIKVSKPFTEYVPGEGMVVGNIGRIVSLPDKMAENRIDAGFGEESTQEAFDAQEEADADAAEGDALENAIANGEIAGLSDEAKAMMAPPQPRTKRGPNKPKPKAPASPVDAPAA